MTTTRNLGSEGSSHFEAPWGAPLRVASVVVTLILVAVAVILLSVMKFRPAIDFAVASIPLLLLVGAAVFMIRGYELSADALVIKRPGWTTRISLADLHFAEIDKEAMSGAIRVFGNGGLFAFNGVFWSKKLGRFRAYVTDLENAIVMKVGDRTIVISPENPDAFIAELKARRLLS